VEATPDPALYQRIMRLIFGAILSKSVYAAAKLGIADELAKGALPVEELARRTETDPDALYRLLRALAGEGLFDEVEPRIFSLTDLGRLISEDAPASRRYLSLMFAEQTDPVFEHILDSIRTGARRDHRARQALLGLAGRQPGCFGDLQQSDVERGDDAAPDAPAAPTVGRGHPRGGRRWRQRHGSGGAVDEASAPPRHRLRPSAHQGRRGPKLTGQRPRELDHTSYRSPVTRTEEPARPSASQPWRQSREATAGSGPARAA
jgi:hypothetical protein